MITHFLEAIAHKFGVEAGAIASKDDSLFALTHRTSLVHPWPRKFSYQTEFFAPTRQFGEAIEAIMRFFKNRQQEHVLTLYGDLNDTLEAQIAEHHYQLAWSNVLFSKSLREDELKALSPNIHPVLTQKDVDALNQLDPENPSSVESIADPFLVDILIEQNETAVGKAQMVLMDTAVAYVSDMFVAEHARGHGFGRLLLEHLHMLAQSKQVDTMILIPSLMTRQMGFYEKFGYQESTQLHLLIPAK